MTHAIQNLAALALAAILVTTSSGVASAEVVFSYDASLGTFPTDQGWGAFEIDTVGPLTAANVAGTAAANANAVIENVGGVPTLHMRDTLSDTTADLPSYLYAWTPAQQRTLINGGIKFTMVWQGLTAGASNGNVRFGFNGTEFEVLNTNILQDRTVEVTNLSSTLAPLDGQFHTLNIYGRKVGTEFVFSSSVDGGPEVARNVIVNPAPPQVESAVYFGGNSSAGIGSDFLVRSITMETLSLKATVDRNAGPRGTLKLVNNAAPLNIVGYSIASGGGALDPAGWTSITDVYDASGNQSVDANDQWAELTGTTVRNNLAEFEPDGDGANFATGQTINLGNVWIQSPTEDLAVELLLDDGSVIPVHVGYQGNGDERLKFGDLDFDGDLDVSDFQNKFRVGFGVSTTGKSMAEQYQAGDFDANGVVDELDFLLFNDAYRAENPGAAPLSLVVPEPASLGLFAIAASALACIGRSARARRISAASVAAMVVAGGISSTNAADLIAHWKFDEASGATTAVDSVGGGHNATKAGNANSGAAGIIGNAWQFGGTTADRLAVTTAPTGDALLNLGENFSVSGWVKTSATTLGTMFSISDNTVANEELMLRAVSDQGPSGIASGVADFSGRPGVGTGEAMTTSKVNTGQWRFLTVSQNSAGWGLYVDGVLEDSGVAADGLASPVGIGANIVTIGAHNRMGTTTPGYTWALNGAIDDLAVWNDRLTDSEVQNLYLAGLNGVNAATPFTASLGIKVNETTGAISLVNASSIGFDVDMYRIRGISPNSLAPTQWISLDDANLDSGAWTELAATTGKISEGALGESTFFAGNMGDVSLGNAYNKTLNAKDLIFEYHVAGTPATVLYTGVVSYVTGGVVASADFDGNGVVNGNDFLRWQRNFGINNGSATRAQGDANGDGNVTAADLTVWKSQFGTPGSVAATAAVPEPSTFAMAALVLVAALSASLRPRRFAVARQATCVAAAALALSATTASAGITVDRNYRLGDDASEGAAIGITLGSGNGFGSTFDSAGTNGAGDLQDLNVDGNPTYVSVSDRPGAGSTRGASFDGVDDYLWTSAHLSVPGDAWDNTTLFPGPPAFPHNYEGIRNQSMQLWVKPNSAHQNVRQEIINNTGEHGVVITAGNKWGLLSDAEPVIDSGVAVSFNSWSHVMMLSGFSDRVNGRSNVGGVLLINGVAVAARNDAVEFNAAQLLTIGGSRVTQDLPMTNPFRGVIDDVKIGLWGTSSATATNYGTLNLATDNEWIATQLGGKPLADVNLDGIVSGTGTGPAATDDVTKMLQGWGTRKLVNNVQFGDWSTRLQGDLNYDGSVNLHDAFMLRQAFKGLGLELNMEVFAAGVPEPSSLALAFVGFVAVARRRRSRSALNRCS